MGIKESILQASLVYSTARTRFLDPLRSFSERSRFSLDSSDFCSLQVEQTPLFLPNLTVREVFDAIMDNNSSIDMRITDVFGDITTCDDMHYGVSGISQSRFAARLACGVDAEMNVANFFHYFEHMEDEYGGGPVGVFTSDFVDRDELYPYRSTERVRFDITGVLVVQKRKGIRRNHVTGKEEEASVIVITQSALYKCRKPETPLCPTVEDQLHEQLGHWGRLLVSSVIDKARRRNWYKSTPQ